MCIKVSFTAWAYRTTNAILYFARNRECNYVLMVIHIFRNRITGFFLCNVKIYLYEDLRFIEAVQVKEILRLLSACPRRYPIFLLCLESGFAFIGSHRLLLDVGLN